MLDHLPHSCRLWLFCVLIACMAPIACTLRADEMAKIGVPPGPPQDVRQKLRTLVLTDISSTLEVTHSTFFSTLEASGHSLTFGAVDSDELSLQTYGEYQYDNIVIFAPLANEFKNKRTSKSGVSLEDLLSFIDEFGGNILVAGGAAQAEGGGFTTGTAIRKLANECGIDFDAENSAVVDYVHHVKLGDDLLQPDYTLIQSSEIVDAPALVSHPRSAVHFRGMGMLLSPSNALTFAILHGTPTTCSASLSQTVASFESASSGRDVVLVAAMQAANGGRVVISGSVEMFSNAFFVRSASTERFCKELAEWTFRQKGVLSWANLQHHKIGELTNPHMYRMKDVIEFGIDIWELRNGTWKPYSADDVQLEFTMLDPHIRLFLSPPSPSSSSSPPPKEAATFTARFQTPDRYGVFKFVVKYSRLGYNALHMESLVPVRNFKHTDYPRFIWGAAPYYGSALTVVLVLAVFSFFFLYHDDHDDDNKEQAKALLAADEHPSKSQKSKHE